MFVHILFYKKGQSNFRHLLQMYFQNEMMLDLLTVYKLCKLLRSFNFNVCTMIDLFRIQTYVNERLH